MDFDSDPKEFTTKAQKKTKHSPLGITIADGEPVNVSQKVKYWGIIVFFQPQAVFVSKFAGGNETNWSGDELPRVGDVLGMFICSALDDARELKINWTHFQWRLTDLLSTQKRLMIYYLIVVIILLWLSKDSLELSLDTRKQNWKYLLNVRAGH